MKERAYKNRERMERIAYSIRETADMLGYKSPSTLYECIYLPKDHPHHIPTITIPIHRGKLRIPAWWIKQQLEQQTGACGALPDVKSATSTSGERSSLSPVHAGGRPRIHKTADEELVMAGDEPQGGLQ